MIAQLNATLPVVDRYVQTDVVPVERTTKRKGKPQFFLCLCITPRSFQPTHWQAVPTKAKVLKLCGTAATGDEVEAALWLNNSELLKEGKERRWFIAVPVQEHNRPKMGDELVQSFTAFTQA